MRTALGIFLLCIGLMMVESCTMGRKAPLTLDYEKYTLGNGLQVVLHEDRSDPIAAVAILYHVGSGREEQGRTGFAHLFEHMMFQESQHVGQDQFFKKIQGAGGTLNGFTSFDRTGYFEVVPNNALEMALWLESDRMGFLLSTVTLEAMENQQDVVQNEKRQRVDNVPYGHTSYVIHKLMYPEGHPYNWQVIGSFEDLQNATVADVHQFFKKWYGPKNATLVVAGDYDKNQAKEWIEKYFGEIGSSEAIDDPAPRPVTLTETKRAYHEDNFATAPELNMVFPTVQQFQDDAYALELMADLLADGKKAPLYKVIVEGQKLAPSVSARQNSMEVAGDFRIRVRAFPGKKLTDVEQAIFDAFTMFETEKFTDKDLDRIKAKAETSFYEGISSVLIKSLRLATYNEFAGSPGYLSDDLEKTLAVTSEDIWRVYDRYIKGKPYVLTSFVPKGAYDLVAKDSQRFPVVEESITGRAKKKRAEESMTVEPIPTRFDRTIEPEKGPAPSVNVPEVWKHDYSNGLHIAGIEHRELPLVEFSITLKGGLLLDDPSKVGVANLMSDIMMEGTANKTPVELEEAIDGLGATVNMYTTEESIVLRATFLASKAQQLYELVEEILLQPRWDVKEFARIKDETKEQINRNRVNPQTVSREVFNRILYGSENILSNPVIGSSSSVDAISIDDVKQFYQQYFSPTVTHVSVVGDISERDAIQLFKPLEEKWQTKEVTFGSYDAPAPPSRPRVLFVDIPGAKQSVLRVGYLSMPTTDPDYYPATVMNYKLGGSFNGFLNLILREEKGYTYGARSTFSGGLYPGPFAASTAVRSNATYESVKIIHDEIAKYRSGIAGEDLEFTKDALLLSNARRFETLGALLGMVNTMMMYDLPEDYVMKEEEVVRSMSLDRHKTLAREYLPIDKMTYLVVGDARTQLTRLRSLGLGTPVLVDQMGNRVRR